MTTYGTIPAEPLPSSNLRCILNVKERIKSNLGIKRPWREMLQLQSFNLPTSFDEMVERVKINTAYFRYNYVIIILIILFLSLLWHPISLIVFIIMIAAWLFLYFLREEPLVVFDIFMQDTAVMTFLLTVTIILLLFTNVSDNIIIALFMGVVVVVVHGAFRINDDLMFIEDEESFGSVGVMRTGDNIRLKNAASSSFSVS